MRIPFRHEPPRRAPGPRFTVADRGTGLVSGRALTLNATTRLIADAPFARWTLHDDLRELPVAATHCEGPFDITRER